MTTEPLDDRPAARRPVIAAGVAAAVMLGLGLVRIGRSFGYDEGFTYHFFVQGGSIRRALTTQVVFNNHPMFSAIQAALWRVGLTGETPQRLLPVLCAAVTAAAVVWVVGRRWGLVGAATAGVALVLNPLYLEQVRQLRGYALATMAVLIAAILVHVSWTDRRHRWLVLQAVLMVVAVTTHAYSAVTLLAVAVGALVLGRVEWRHVATWVGAAVVALVIMSPVLDDARANAAARGNRYRPSFPIDLTEAMLGRELVAVVITGLAVIAGAIELGRRSPRHAGALTAAAGIVVAVVVVLWQVVQPFDLYSRFFISVVPFLAVLAGIGVASIPRPVAVAVPILLVLSLFGPVRDVLRVEPTIRDAAAVADRAGAQGLRVCGSNAEPLRVYTPPFPLISGRDGFGGCDVFISVLRLRPDVRDAAGDWYSGQRPLGGGVIVWADDDVLAVIAPD